jgi:hypothetical protein
MPPDEFGRTVLGDKTVGLGWRWKNAATGQPAYVMIERNNHGHATLTGSQGTDPGGCAGE